jgi:hypothetical protein
MMCITRDTPLPQEKISKLKLLKMDKFVDIILYNTIKEDAIIT